MTEIRRHRATHACAGRLRLALLVIAIAAGMPFGSLAQTGGRTAVSFALPIPVAAGWPVYVAKKEGLFDQARLDVTVRYPATGSGGVQELITGSLNIYATNPDQPAVAMDKGAGIVGVSGTINSTFSLIVAPGIDTMKDLRGKKLGTAVLGTADAALIKAILDKNVIAPADYQIVETGSGLAKIAALDAGIVQGVTLTQPNDFIYLSAQPKAKALASSAELGALQTIAAFVNRPWAEANKTAVAAFIAAQLRAASWLDDPANEMAAVDILVAETRAPPEMVRRTYDLYRKDGLFKSAIDVNLQGIGAWMQLAGDAANIKFRSPDHYMDVSYLTAAKAMAAGK
jgi:ABC-type nitrate/sulfonate/bicarbonate transport system substrate-binding protein